MAEDAIARAARSTKPSSVDGARGEGAAESGDGGPVTPSRIVRLAAFALVPPLIGLTLELTVFANVGSRWLLMVPAVIVSAANGGMASGLASTLTSAALVWWFLIPSVQTPGAALSLVLFLAIGYAISLLHERLRRTTDGLAHAVRQNQIFAALIENSLDFIGVADSAGKATYVNPAGKEMVELPSDVEVERTTITDYYPADLREFARTEIVAAMVAQGKWAGETSFRNWRTGEHIPVLDTHFLVRNPATGRVMAMATITRDISAYKAQRDALEQTNEQLAAAMRELGESQRFLQGILDYSPNAIVIKNLDGQYLIVNNGFRSITGLGPAAARGKSDVELLPSSLARRLHANDQQALATGQAVFTEESLDLDGQHRDFLVTKFPLLDETNTIFALCGIWTDITQRRRDEESLRQVASDLRTAQRVAHVGSWRWDLRTGESEWSEELYRVFGLEPAQGRRTPLFTDPESKILTAQSRARVQTAVEQLQADGRPYEIELEVARPDGTLAWVAARGEAMRDEDGRIVGITGTVADITRIKQLQRLHDEWTSVIAHDLRQPISTILMASEFLPELHAGKPNEREREMVERIHMAAGSLRRMVDDLLDMSLLEANRLKLERVPARPHSLVHETLEQLAHLPGIERVHECAAPDLPAIQVDPMRIEQVLQNLISNAIKYGDPSGDVTVREEQRGKEIEITVTNHGQGIAVDELPRLFDRFTRSRSTRGSGTPGLGLGLYIAKGIVEAHGGRIWAESVPCEVTTFHVALPVSGELLEAA